MTKLKVYTVYKTTNIKTDEYYIGFHATTNPNDSYMGSGSRISDQLKTHGHFSFRKDILFTYTTIEPALEKEGELIANAISNPLCLNIWNGTRPAEFIFMSEALRAHLSKLRKGKPSPRKGAIVSSETRQILSLQKLGKPGNPSPLKGKTIEEVYGEEKAKEWIQHLSDAQKRNPKGISTKSGHHLTHEHKKKVVDYMLGTILINNGIVSKRIHSADLIPDGWVKGRLKLKKKRIHTKAPWNKGKKTGPQSADVKERKAIAQQRVWKERKINPKFMQAFSNAVRESHKKEEVLI